MEVSGEESVFLSDKSLFPALSGRWGVVFLLSPPRFLVDNSHPVACISLKCLSIHRAERRLLPISTFPFPSIPIPYHHEWCPVVGMLCFRLRHQLPCGCLQRRSLLLSRFQIAVEIRHQPCSRPIIHFPLAHHLRRTARHKQSPCQPPNPLPGTLLSLSRVARRQDYHLRRKRH